MADRLMDMAHTTPESEADVKRGDILVDKTKDEAWHRWEQTRDELIGAVSAGLVLTDFLKRNEEAVRACVAEALADTLALLERWARKYGRIQLGEDHTVRFVIRADEYGGLRYWWSVCSQPKEITREAVAALLAGKGDEHES